MRQFVSSPIVRCFIVTAISVWFFTAAAYSSAPSEVEVRLGVQNLQYTCQEPYFFGEFDSAGYSDWIWYGLSPTHDYQYHEMLSGEWASAIYYDGIDTGIIDPNDPEHKQYAMWLTDEFIYPDWTTNSNFIVPDPLSCLAWQDPNNPVPEINTSKTVIANDEVEITVDMELVDLEQVSPGARSPMSYRFPNNSSSYYVNSERYVMLQTYTIRNLKTEPLENLEFYQMLQAHPADEKAAAVYSAYETYPFMDPLEYYTPRNPVHQVGNFRYDITQWNDVDSEHASVDHVDWFGFSTTVAPDMIDHDVYKGHAAGKPSIGTHINVENRSLNGADHLYDTEPAAAVFWDMGSMDAGQACSITFAIMFGHDNSPDKVTHLDIDAEIASQNPCGVDPSDPNLSEMVYTITYGNPISDPNNPDNTLPVQDATLIVQLPEGVDFVSAGDPNIFSYDPDGHEGTWVIGLIEPGQYRLFRVTVNANLNAEPGSDLSCRALGISEFGTVSDSVKTKVCCWLGRNIFYVDRSATGTGTGLTWQNAYSDLLEALEQARHGCASQIWVAEGIYNSSSDSGTGTGSFLLLDGVNVYGGFPSGGGQWQERDFVANKTVLCGNVERVGTNSVVDANDIGEDTVFDGFVIVNGTENGISCQRSDMQISNCYIAKNACSGIVCNGSSPVITGCVIAGNLEYGILCSDDPLHERSGSPEISGNRIYFNAKGGIKVDTALSKPKIANNWIYDNGDIYYGGSGITIDDASEPIAIRNNTIVGNLYIGIESLAGIAPEIENCIIWNHPVDLIGCTALSSCYTGAPAINGNIDDNPQFAYADSNDYHIASMSPCIDTGDLWNIEPGETDIDGNERIYGEQVDIGADEYTCSDTICKADFNKDRIVDLGDLALLAGDWLADYQPDDPNTTYDIAPEGGDDRVDMYDLRTVAEDWFWQPCWIDAESKSWIHNDDYKLIVMLCSE